MTGRRSFPLDAHNVDIMKTAASTMKIVKDQEKTNTPAVKAPMYQKWPMRKLKSPALK